VPALSFPQIKEPPPVFPWTGLVLSELHAAPGIFPAADKLVSHIVTHSSSPTKKLVTSSATQTVMPTQIAVMNRDSISMGFLLSSVDLQHEAV
jgi:hypothetical protein